MEQEAAQELIDSQSHEPFLVAVRGIAPAEGDVAIGESDQPGVRDSDAMGVGAEIAQHMFRSAEGRLGVDDPVVAEQHPQPCERRRAVAASGSRLPWNWSSPRWNALRSPATNLPRKTRLSTPMGRKKERRAEIQLE